jgi:hypothetical protein
MVGMEGVAIVCRSNVDGRGFVQCVGHVAVPRHCAMDPDPRIRASDYYIRIRIQGAKRTRI